MNDNPKLREIFSRAAEMPVDQRPAYLDAACAGNAEWRAEIESLLGALNKAGESSVQPAGARAAFRGDVTEDASAEPIGSRIGPYKLLQLLGEGGMGIVYLAEQKEPVYRRVALKIIKPGMDSAAVIARFEAERQALALMDHSNIARVYDAGTTSSGRPYFVMELVQGIPITTYCDENRVSTERRLELFISVCRAVQHAHQKGIIHRDLKPGNVLVAVQDDKPVVKVIDFGIAKALNQSLTEKTIFTQAGMMVGTPQYMSPEQAGFGPEQTDTRSDVYSLGVILYELLTGSTPLDAKKLRQAGYEQMMREIRESEPPKPSTRLSSSEMLASVSALRKIDPRKLATLLTGDLDCIVMKCLEKDRARRYETVSGLARDIERYFSGEPITARPAGAIYMLRKFARRHSAGITVAGVVLAAVLVGLGVATTGFIRASHDRDLARASEAHARQQTELATENANRAAAVRDFLQNMLSTADPAKLMGADVTVRQAVDAAAKELDDGLLTDQPQVQCDIHSTIGTVYQALGLHKQAEPHFRKALALVGTDPRQQALALDNLALSLTAMGRRSEAVDLYTQGLAVAEKLNPPDPGTVAYLHQNYGLCLMQMGDLDGSRVHVEKAIELRKNLPATLDQARVQNLLVLEEILRQKGDIAGARAALMTAKSLCGNDPVARISIDHNLAVLLGDEEKFDQAIPIFQKVLADRQALYGKPHQDIVITMLCLADALRRTGHADPALSYYKDASEMSRTVSGDSEATANAIEKTGVCLLENFGKPADAEPQFREALTMYDNNSDTNPANVSEGCYWLASTLIVEKNYAAAKPLCQRAVSIRQQHFPPDSTYLAGARIQLAIVLYRLKEYPEAESHARDLSTLTLPPGPDTDMVHAQSLMLLSRICSETNRPDEAKQYFNRWKATQPTPTSAPATTVPAAR